MKNFIKNQKVFVLTDPVNFVEAVFVRYLTSVEKLKLSETSSIYLDCSILINSKEYLSNSFYIYNIH